MATSLRKELCGLHLELFHCFLFYYQHEQATVRIPFLSLPPPSLPPSLPLSPFPPSIHSFSQHHLHTAGKLAGISSSLTGVLGKRTRFQQEDIAQLLLEVTTTIQEGEEEEEEEEEDVQRRRQFPRVRLFVCQFLAMCDPYMEITWQVETCI